MPSVRSRALLVVLSVAVPALVALGACGDDPVAESPDASDASTIDGSVVDGASTIDASDAATKSDAAPPSTFLTGTNLSGAEFASGTLPGTYGSTYTYPTHAELDYFASKGFKVVRIPFLWARMQPTLDQALDAPELARLVDVVDYAATKGLKSILDPHDYARYKGVVIGSGGNPSTAQFGDFWSKLALAFKAKPSAIFGIMNEPHGMATELWLTDANAAIDAIRKAGATQLVLVPGNGYTGAHSWDATYYGTANATVMLGVVDSANNYAYEAHQYLDADSSGTQPTCTSATAGADRLAKFTTWLTTNKRRGFLGEFAVGSDATCAAALEGMLAFIDQHRDVWLGWTWWSAGPWWGNYMFSLEPANNVDKPVLATLLEHL
ncbi:glycoside hydrolase family 5 protein [soil metagenome]